MGEIVVEGLGKAYKQYQSRWSRLYEWLIPWATNSFSLKWVLKDLNFSVASGEALGIVGINGAGKSTLLKMIAGTVSPTIGRVKTSGRVAALLELGMGFHGDFTGRQNAYMAGQLLGMSIQEINQLMPKIEDFAEIGEYIDQPVRVYSSGMQMRLAFSVATAKRPDILIIDEALSVGDTYFQHKSFSRIREFRELGTTLLIVSHDKSAIQSICDKAILLNAGKLEMEGRPEDVMDFYNAMLADRENRSIKQVLDIHSGALKTVSGSGEVSLNGVSICDVEGNSLEVVRVGQQVSLKVLAECHQPINELVIGYLIKDRLGHVIFGTNTHHTHDAMGPMRPNQTVEYIFSFGANLGPGSYSISIALHEQDTHMGKNYEWRDRALIFNVINAGENDFVGVNWLPPTVAKYYD